MNASHGQRKPDCSLPAERDRPAGRAARERDGVADAGADGIALWQGSVGHRTTRCQDIQRG